MSFSSKLKTLQSLAQSLDYLHTMLSVSDISLEDYIFVSDMLNKLAAIHEVLESRNIVLEITEDEKGTPIGHRLYVEKPLGGTEGVSVFWDLIPFDFKSLCQKDPRGEPLNAHDAGLDL